MPVMRHLNVGGTTYDTVGEASVTQVLSSGTKIATVSIDGTSTDLYAPAGGSSVDPATAAPSMDGTAAVGSSVKYAREDHVHPSDTSRLSGVILNTSSEPYNVPVANSSATIYIGDGLSVSDSNDRITLKAKTGTTSTTVAVGNHTHTVAGINGLQSALDAKQATLVSGTNIKTINNESLLGSGNIAISGGVSMSTATVTLTSSGWSGGVQVVHCSGMTQTCNVIISPDPNSATAWAASGVICTGQTPTTLTFIFNNAAPTQNLYANVLILD